RRGPRAQRPCEAPDRLGLRHGRERSRRGRLRGLRSPDGRERRVRGRRHPARLLAARARLRSPPGVRPLGDPDDQVWSSGVVFALLVLTGCAHVSRQHPVASVQELSGDWRGRLALQLANAAATMTIKEDGTYRGALHLDGGDDRPFNGAITVLRPG